MKTIQNTQPTFNPSFFNISVGTHRGKNVIWLKFEYNQNLINILKSQTPAKWSQTKRTWYLVDNKHNRALCQLKSKIVGKAVIEKISPVNQEEFTKFQNEIQLKGYSENTLRTYSLEFAQLLYLLKNNPVKKLSAERLKSYFLYCTKELNLSERQIHSRMNAIKFYFEKVLHHDKIFFDIPRPKKPLTLPKSLSLKEVQKLFAVTTNCKHRLILKFCYGLGLRVSEITTLHLSNIDTDRMLVLVSRSKGKKDRMVTLPNTIVPELNHYLNEYDPKGFLFEGQYGGKYSTRSAQSVFKTAMKKAGIKKKIGIHGLRHSYATHLLEFGTDISLIQKLLGHNNIKTTLMYTHVSKNALKRVKSPLDQMK